MPDELDFDLPEDIQAYYNEGMCLALALVLARRTGWRMVAVWGLEGERAVLAHVACEHPLDPRFLVDVLGVRSLPFVFDNYYDLDEPWVERCTERNIARWAGRDLLHSVTSDMLAEAEPWAEKVLSFLSRTGHLSNSIPEHR